jgi:hypothetical protein
MDDIKGAGLYHKVNKGFQDPSICSIPLQGCGTPEQLMTF